MTEALAQQVIIDNRSGASGMISMQLAAQAAPDGYTLLVFPFPGRLLCLCAAGKG